MKTHFQFLLFISGFCFSIGCGSSSELQEGQLDSQAPSSQCLRFPDGKNGIDIVYSLKNPNETSRVSVELQDLNNWSTNSQDALDCADKTGNAYDTCVRERYNQCFAFPFEPCKSLVCPSGDCTDYTQICFKSRVSDSWTRNLFIENPLTHGICCGPEAKTKRCIVYENEETKIITKEGKSYALKQYPGDYDKGNDKYCNRNYEQKLKCTEVLSKQTLGNSFTVKAAFGGIVSNATTAQTLCWNNVKGKRVIFTFQD